MAIADIGPKNRLNAHVIGEIARMVFGPSPTDDEYNAVAAEMEEGLHGDIARLAEDIRLAAHRMCSRRSL